MGQLPLPDKQNLTDEEFFNRIMEITTLTNLLNSTKSGNAPNLLLTGIRGVGKTVFLRKIKQKLEKDYLVVYIDFSRAECYQKDNLSINGLMEHYYNELLNECKRKGLTTIDKKITKYFKTNNFKIKDVKNVGGYSLPVIGSEKNSEKFINFVLNLPQQIYEEDEFCYQGILIFIDEFQIIKELNKYMESFLWKFRSFIQNQNFVSYVLSGSMSLQDELITKIASRGGVFGGRMMTFHINPFDKNTVKKYLDEKANTLIFSDDGFERFYKCTSGIPSYINLFGRLLPSNVQLDAELVKKEFINAIPLLSTQLINIWSRLSSTEQEILISLLNNDLKRIKIADYVGVKSGSLSRPLNKLQNEGLIMIIDGKYQLTEPMLGKWLKLEYERKGIYPYRRI
ncbi:MAG: ATP-binding protein [Methanosphaera stadtmanae]|nr:ATP-binding protein [Methanosphaera stadtmanae]